jgi:hypothetical protein
METAENIGLLTRKLLLFSIVVSLEQYVHRITNYYIPSEWFSYLVIDYQARRKRWALVAV